MQFFIAPAALASLLFNPPKPQHIEKTQCCATFLPFRAPASSFVRRFLFSDLLYSAFLFSDCSHLCFSSVHIVGSLTSKLPSNIGSVFPRWLDHGMPWKFSLIFIALVPCPSSPVGKISMASAPGSGTQHMHSMASVRCAEGCGGKQRDSTVREEVMPNSIDGFSSRPSQ